MSRIKNSHLAVDAMSEKRKLVVFIASSLDGYIASKDDSLEWLIKSKVKGITDLQSFMPQWIQFYLVKGLTIG
ncbi:hypothetical protein ACFSCZ_04685 [Siminovitchia sediminis]|uniref:Dihydrofolate reductase n=1 Tax=Siminovitchia sediminis TaxID=1274353 RepID=A0ABW4KEV0_9BACI